MLIHRIVNMLEYMLVPLQLKYILSNLRIAYHLIQEWANIDGKDIARSGPHWPGFCLYIS